MFEFYYTFDRSSFSIFGNQIQLNWDKQYKVEIVKSYIEDEGDEYGYVFYFPGICTMNFGTLGPIRSVGADDHVAPIGLCMVRNQEVKIQTISGAPANINGFIVLRLTEI